MIQDITTTQAQVLPSVSSEESHLKIRLNPDKYPHYCRVTPADRVTKLKMILTACYAMKHISDASPVNFDGAMLDQQIMANSNYRELTLNEINKALTDGACGLYGECHAITIEFCLSCLGKFIQANESVYLKARRAKEQGTHPTIEEMRRKYAYMMAKANEERNK